MRARSTDARERAESGGGGVARHWRRRWAVPLRYALYQLPELLVVILVLTFVVWAEVIAVRGAVLLALLWLAKEAALYPLTRDAYAGATAVDTHRMIGRRGVARRRLAPRGWVFVGGALWRADAAPDDLPLEAGAEVEVIEVRGNRLTVAAVRDRGAS